MYNENNAQNETESYTKWDEKRCRQRRWHREKIEWWKITGHRRICRFGANTNDKRVNHHIQIHIYTSTLHFIAIKYVSIRPKRQTDTSDMAGKHIQYTKYQFEVIGANRSMYTAINYSGARKVTEYESKELRRAHNCVLFAFLGSPVVLPIVSCLSPTIPFPGTFFRYSYLCVNFIEWRKIKGHTKNV